MTNAPPKSLEELQAWFAGVIRAPLVDGLKIKPLSPSEKPIVEESKRYIKPNAFLDSHQRIEIYNQQYWWRLLKILQENFPTLARLFGTNGFNKQIATPFLCECKAPHWSLNKLGISLPDWIKRSYNGKDKELLYASSLLDQAFTSSFVAADLPPLDIPKLINEYGDELTSCVFSLQPHVEVFHFRYDLLKFRELLVKQQVDYWIKKPFPKLSKERDYYFVFFRTRNNLLSWRQIKKGEWHLLSSFKKGTSIDMALEALDENDSMYQEIEENLENWIQNWTAFNLLTRG